MRWLPLLAAAFALTAAGAEPRLAIVAEPSAQASAEALAAALEKQPGLTLTAPAADNAGQIRQLSELVANKHFRELAKQLGVDGLVWLDAHTGTEIVAQLIAPGPEISLATVHRAAPVADPAAWSEAVVRQFTPLLGKLAGTATNAVPVSVIDFRATAGIPDPGATERALTLRLIHRLTHEPALVVLEREQLGAPGGSIERYSANAGPFWDRRWIVEGTVGVLANDPGKLSLNFRLRSPGGGPKAEFAHACRPDEVTATLNVFAAELLKEFGLEPTPAAWEPAAEAGRWFEEARWAAANELWPWAGAAAESAAALGAREAELVAIQVRAANHTIAAPYFLRPAAPGNFVGRLLAERADRIAHWPAVSAEIAKLSATEKLQSVESARRAQEILRRRMDMLPPEARNALATEAAAHASTVLEWFTRNGDAATFRDNLAALRQAVRENVTRILLTAPDSRAVDDLFCVSAFLHPLWHELPEDVLATWQTRLLQPATPGQAAVLRVALARALREFPNFAGGAENLSARECWEKIVVEQEKSPRAADRLAGFALHHDLATNATLRTALARKTRDTLWDLRDELAREPATFRLFFLYRDSTGAAPDFDPVTLGEPRSVPASSDADRDFLRDYITHLLRESRDVAWAALDALVRPDDYTPEQATEVLAALDAHRARLASDAARAGLDRARKRVLERFSSLPAKKSE